MTQLQIEPVTADLTGRRFRAYTAKHLDGLVQRAGLSPSERLAVRAVGLVLPFRTNDYVVENLIDWRAAPNDPIYRLVFPQPDMLPADDIDRLSCLLARCYPPAGSRVDPLDQGVPHRVKLLTPLAPRTPAASGWFQAKPPRASVTGRRPPGADGNGSGEHTGEPFD